MDFAEGLPWGCAQSTAVCRFHWSQGSVAFQYISSSSLSVAGDPQQKPVYGRDGSNFQEAAHSLH